MACGTINASTSNTCTRTKKYPTNNYFRFSPISSKNSFLGRLLRFRNFVFNALWPTQLWQMFALMAFCGVLLVALPTFPSFLVSVCHGLGMVENLVGFVVSRLSRAPRTDHALACKVVTAVISGATGFFALLTTRRLLLRSMLSYNSWIYDGRSISIRTKIWAFCVRLLSHHESSMFGCQSILPSQPLPRLHCTMERLVSSMRTLYGADSPEYEFYSTEAEKFKFGIGPKLQRLLIFKSWFSTNWVSDWWLVVDTKTRAKSMSAMRRVKYMYLSSRSSLAINSNFYIVDQMHWLPTDKPISRASYVIFGLLRSKVLIEMEQIPVIILMETIPTCMQQYKDIYGTVRVPGVECDVLQCYKSSHVRGIYYDLCIYDQNGQALTAKAWERQLTWLVRDANQQCEHLATVERNIPSLTALGRTEWAVIRNQHFSHGVNKTSLLSLESALFHPAAATSTPQDPSVSYNPDLTSKTTPLFAHHYGPIAHHYGPFAPRHQVVIDPEPSATPMTWSDRGKRLLHGDCERCPLWFDKVMTVVVFADAHYGIHVEHTPADAPIIAHLHRNNIIKECTVIKYDENGHCTETENDESIGPLFSGKRLVWKIEDKLKIKIENAVKFAEKNNENADLVIQEFTYFGMNFIKKCKVSPDAFIQTAIQLAYYRQSKGQFVHTYEPAMMRLYRNGRTETIRSLTELKKAFVVGIYDESISREQKIEMLRQVSADHKKLSCDAMAGKGIDRHLFALYVAARGMGLKSELLEKALMLPWKLSTSTSPSLNSAENINIGKDKYRYMLCGGGGFGAVSSDGYGISYIGPGGKRLYFHVASSKSCPETDSMKMKEEIFRSLYDMRRLFDPQIPEEPHEFILKGCVDDLSYDLAPLDTDDDSS